MTLSPEPSFFDHLNNNLCLVKCAGYEIRSLLHLSRNFSSLSPYIFFNCDSTSTFFFCVVKLYVLVGTDIPTFERYTLHPTLDAFIPTRSRKLYFSLSVRNIIFLNFKYIFLGNSSSSAISHNGTLMFKIRSENVSNCKPLTNCVDSIIYDY